MWRRLKRGDPAVSAKELAQLRRQARELTRRIDELAAAQARAEKERAEARARAEKAQAEARARARRQLSEGSSQGDAAEGAAETPSATDEPRRPGVRLEDLPSPVAKQSRLRRILGAVLVVVLVVAAFVAGYFWTDLEERVRDLTGAEQATVIEDSPDRAPLPAATVAALRDRPGDVADDAPATASTGDPADGSSTAGRTVDSAPER